MMAYLTRRYALIDFGLFLIMALGSDGGISTPPSNKAVLKGATRVNMSCASNLEIGPVNWNFAPVGGSYTPIAAGKDVVRQQTQFYAAAQLGMQSNLTILTVTADRAGTYVCSDASAQLTFAHLIVINSVPVCTENASTEVLWNESVQMSCNISFTANTSYVHVNMSWSKGDPATIVASGPPVVITDSPTLLTAVSTIIPTAGFVTPFPKYICTIAFTVSGYPSPSSNNAPDYSKSISLFSNSPPNVIYLKPADANSIKGAKDGEKVYRGTNVTCSVESNPPAYYSWRDVGSQNTTYSSNIQIWHNGEYTCTASNTVGNSSVSINVTTYSDDKSAEPARDKSGLSDRTKIIVGVVVGVLGALLIAAAAILTYWCRRKKSNTEIQRANTVTETSNI